MSDAELQGADQLVSTLRDAAQALQDLSAAEHEAGQLLAQAGSAAAPRETGNLAAKHGYDVVAAQVSVTAATPYASRVHARQPWLADTLTARADEVADVYLAGVEDALAQVRGT